MISFFSTFFLSLLLNFSTSFAQNELIMVPKEIATYFSYIDNSQLKVSSPERFSPMEESIVMQKIAVLENLLHHSHALMNFNKENNNQAKITSKECLFGVDVALIKMHVKKFKRKVGLVDSITKSNEYNTTFINDTTIEKTSVLPANTSFSITLKN